MFTHLHVHSHFSFFDSPTAPAALVKKAATLGMPALALTDHGVLHGVPSFVAACRRHGVRPVAGVQLAFCPGDKGGATVAARAGTGRDGAPFELVLLCHDQTGYHNLCRLSSAAQAMTWGCRPQPLSVLQEQAGGLVCLSGSVRGPLAGLLAVGERKRAADLAGLLRELFCGAFFIEVPATGAVAQPVLAGLVDLARELAVPLAATADVHYAEPREATVRRLLLAGQRSSRPGQPHDAAPASLRKPGGRESVGPADRDGPREDSPQQGDGPRESGDLWLCSEREIRRRLAFLPRAVAEEALANTVAIAEECHWDLEPLAGAEGGGLPDPACPAHSADDLRRLVDEGRRSRYPTGEPSEVAPRLERELEVTIGRGLADYFLLAHRVASWCHREGIPVGPGRGSAAGSLVCYCLGITDVDPLEEGLMFERFLNPERPDLPDIDMDVCQRRRPEVIAMLTGQAGAVGVVTFTTLGARSALRLAGRALGLPPDRIGALTAAFPGERGPGALAHALASVPELRAIPRDREPFRTLFGAAALLEGIPVGRSRHPSGVVVIPPGQREELPLYRAPDGQPVSQYDAESLEMLGVPKLDVLGLRHLTVAGDTERMVRQAEPAFSVDRLDPDDPITWDLIGAAETVGCFQLESEGMRHLLERMQPRSLPDLATAIASYKPGPLRARSRRAAHRRAGDTGAGDSARAAGAPGGASPAAAGRGGPPTEVSGPPPLLQDILAPTRGILVYQEQVMEAGQRLAGMTAGKADLMRRLLEKGQRLRPALLREWEARFVSGARERGIPEAEARDAFHWLSRAAGYTFNRAHATCYARLAYQAAYLKAHHPAPYLAALLSNPGGYYPPDLYLYEARRLGIAVLPAHPNHSGAFWRAEKGAIRAGLLSLPGVGLHAALACLRERARGGDFRSPQDLTLRLRGKVPRAALSALLLAREEAERPGAGRTECARPDEQPARADDQEVILEGRVVQGQRVPAPGGGYRLVLLLDTGREMVHVHVPARVYERDALALDPRHLTVRGRLDRRGGHLRLLASALGSPAFSIGRGGES
ncbi:MAG: DNA polymerase III subunit alpha [Bacillota bacterium]|nr:DNA polymerase III subunit alpha [Bacillota bacterium]